MGSQTRASCATRTSTRNTADSNEELNCKKCKKFCETTELHLCCEFCEEKFHTTCLKMNTANLNKALKQQFWFCSQKCNAAFEKSTQDIEPVTAKEKVTLDDIMEKIRENQESLQFMSTMYEDNKMLIKEMTLLKKHNIEITNELNYLRHEVNQLKHDKIKKNIIVYGIENEPNNEEKEKDIVDKFTNIVKSINVIVTNDDIDKAYRINSNKNKKGPVVIEFRKNSTKMDVMLNKKNLWNKESSKNVRINEQLTTYSYNLLLQARESLNKNFKYIWSRDGKVMIKKDEDSKAREIKSVNDIYYFEQN